MKALALYAVVSLSFMAGYILCAVMTAGSTNKGSDQ